MDLDSGMFGGEKIKIEPIHRKGKCDFWLKNQNRFCMCKNKKGSRFCRFHIVEGINSDYVFPNKECEEVYERYEKPTNCPVCFEKWGINDTRPLECGHWVHMKCICNFHKAECPICRHQLTKLSCKQIKKINENMRQYRCETEEEEMFNIIINSINDNFENIGGEDDILLGFMEFDNMSIFLRHIHGIFSG